MRDSVDDDVGNSQEDAMEVDELDVVVVDRWRVWTNALQLLWWWATVAIWSFDGRERDETLRT